MEGGEFMRKQMILGIMLFGAMTTEISASASDMSQSQLNNVTDIVSPITYMMRSVNETFSQYLTTHTLVNADRTEQETPVYDFSALDANIEVCMHPITGEYSLRKVNPATGKYERSYDGGETWEQEVE